MRCFLSTEWEMCHTVNVAILQVRLMLFHLSVTVLNPFYRIPCIVLCQFFNFFLIFTLIARIKIQWSCVGAFYLMLLQCELLHFFCGTFDQRINRLLSIESLFENKRTKLTNTQHIFKFLRENTIWLFI